MVGTLWTPRLPEDVTSASVAWLIESARQVYELVKRPEIRTHFYAAIERRLAAEGAMAEQSQRESLHQWRIERRGLKAMKRQLRPGESLDPQREIRFAAEVVGKAGHGSREVSCKRRLWPPLMERTPWSLDMKYAALAAIHDYCIDRLGTDAEPFHVELSRNVGGASFHNCLMDAGGCNYFLRESDPAKRDEQVRFVAELIDDVRADLVDKGHVPAPELGVQSGDALPAGRADAEAVAKESPTASLTQAGSRAVDNDSPRLSQVQANVEAERLTRNDPSFKKLSVHNMAEQIGCSPTTLRATLFWDSLVAEQPHRKRSKGPTPKVVALTDAVAAVTPQTTEPDDILLTEMAAAEDRVAEERAIEAVWASGLDNEGKAALVRAIQEGETPPQKAIAIAAEYPKARAVRPHKQV